MQTVKKCKNQREGMMFDFQMKELYLCVAQLLPLALTDPGPRQT